MTTGLLLFWLIPAGIIVLLLAIDVYTHGDDLRVKDLLSGIFVGFMPVMNILFLGFVITVYLNQKDFWNIVIWRRK